MFALQRVHQICCEILLILSVWIVICNILLKKRMNFKGAARFDPVSHEIITSNKRFKVIFIPSLKYQRLTPNTIWFYTPLVIPTCYCVPKSRGYFSNTLILSQKSRKKKINIKSSPASNRICIWYIDDW